MALRYYGGDESQWTIKTLAKDHRDIFSSTTFQAVQQAVQSLGYTWDRWRWVDDSMGFANAIRAVEQSLDDRKPVILGVVHSVLPGEPLWTHSRVSRHQSHVVRRAHALLAFGYDSRSQELFLLDPAEQFPGKRHMPFKELREIWDRNGQLYAMFTAPKGELPDGHHCSK